MKILKFGGSSVAQADTIRRVVRIVDRARGDRPVVVVSAVGGVTDTLLEAASRAADDGESWREHLADLRRRHHDTADDLAADSERAEVVADLGRLFDDLAELLHGVSLLRECSDRTRDRVLATGELASSRIVAAALRAAGIPAIAVDARTFVRTDRTFGDARVDPETTAALIRADLANRAGIPVVTGFLGATDRGATTTLGRGGSDLTASLVGAALGADEIQLWTDVSGVMSCDPRLVPDAYPLPALSYDELMELSHFGAKVVHPPSVHPARAAGIALSIRNTFDPEATGTMVTEAAVASEQPVRGLASIPDVALLRLEGDGMVGVPGIAERLFGALAAHRISVILISQASSEHSICLAVAPADADDAAEAVDAAFALERAAGLVNPLVVEEDLAVIAVVGQTMCRAVGISGRLFGILGRVGVNVRAIAQGSSERNISLVVARADQQRAMAAIHGAFFDGGRQRVDLMLAGVGGVGTELLRQIREHQDSNLDLRVVAVAASRRAAVDSGGLALDRWRASLDASNGPADWPTLRRDAASRPWPTVFVDGTASQAVADDSGAWLRAGVSVVAANKKAFAAPTQDYERLMAVHASSSATLLHEATVGAGLPILTTIADLVGTGDRIHRMEGLLSGSVAFILERVRAGARFSEAAREALELGYLEPHPADDLCGLDVARKLVILARAAGRQADLDGVRRRGLLPDEWASLSADDLWRRLPELDDDLARRVERAAGERRRLVFLAKLGDDGLEIGLEAVDEGHPAAGARGTDSILAITTDRYAPTPLTIQGPGAGPTVTASGVLADILRVARRQTRSTP
jgi:aspartokinase/homoserine dehydrogenase 1